MSIQPVQAGLPSPPARSSPQAVATSSPPAANMQPGASSLQPASGVSGANFAITGRDQAAAGSVGGKSEPVTREQQLLDAISQLEKIIQPVVRDISFSIHDKTGDVVVRIIDRESQEVIRQIPSEEMLKLAERLESLGPDATAPGLLLRQEA